eukprot:gene3957-4234_t
MEVDGDIERAFQQLKNVRLEIYKALSDIDQLCVKSDKLTTDIVHEYISEKERISSNQLNDNDSLSPFKTKSGSFHLSKEATKINCFPQRKQEQRQHRTTRKGESDILVESDIQLPTLFQR